MNPLTPRVLWFVAGAASAVYVSAKARKLAYRVSMPGLVDQTEAATAGMREFAAQVREGMQAKEAQFRADIISDLQLSGPKRPELPKDPS